MDKIIKIKSVAFNVNDPDQLQFLEHAEKRTNFSAYIKRLIQRDIEGVREYIQEVETPDEQTITEDYRSFL